MEQRTKASRDALASDRERGRAEALAFDRALREREAAERERRLAEDEARRGPRPAAAPAQRDELRRLADYIRAVHDSRGWRALQWLRRLAGRSW